MNAVGQYWRGLARQWRGWAVLMGCSVLEGLPAFFSGALVQLAVDAFAGGRPSAGLRWLAAFLAAAVVGALGARWVWARLGSVVEPVRDTLVGVVVRGVLRDRAGHRIAPDASAVARIAQHVEVVRDATAGMLVQARGMVVTAVAAVLGVAAVAGDAVWLVAVPVAVAVAAFCALLPALARGQRRLTLADEATAGTAGDVLAGLPDITAFDAREDAVRWVREAAERQAAAARGLAGASALRVGVVATGAFLPVVLVLATSELAAGALLGVLVYLTGVLYPALNGLASTASTVVLRLVVALRRLAEASSSPPPDRGSAVPAVPLVSVRGLTHAWGTHAEPVLRDFSLDLVPGDHLCVVGPSGIGKSTLAGLVTGLLPLQRGRVTIGGVPVSEVDPRVVAFTPQEAYVFAGSLRENLSLLNPGAGDARLLTAASEVAGDLVERLGGLDREIGAGELGEADRQLLALARVHASDAPVVVLDEAMSRLSAAQEAAAEAVLARRGGVLVVVAHRMTSAERAGRVLLMDGRDAVVGDHRGLAARSAQYAGLVNAWGGFS